MSNKSSRYPIRVLVCFKDSHTHRSSTNLLIKDNLVNRLNEVGNATSSRHSMDRTLDQWGLRSKITLDLVNIMCVGLIANTCYLLCL